MKIYAIVTLTRVSYGRDGGDEWLLIRDGAYGAGKFPPFFQSKQDAENYLKDCPLPKYLYQNCKVEEVELITKNENISTN